MSKSSNTFTCTACGASHKKWNGQCDACMAWNTLVEESPLSAGPKGPVAKGRTIALTDLATQAEAQACADAIHAKMQEVDPAYAKSVAAGHTTAWAIPYQDGAVWCVNVKQRGGKGLRPGDVPKLKPIP